MLAQGFLNPVEEAHAKLQEQVGSFLSNRARLLRLRQHSSPSIQSEANGLYAVQLQLESELQSKILPMIDRMKSGSWAISDVIQIGSFTQAVIRQIRDVNSLESKASGVRYEGFGITTLSVPAIIGAMALAYFLIRRV